MFEYFQSYQFFCIEAEFLVDFAVLNMMIRCALSLELYWLRKTGVGIKIPKYSCVLEGMNLEVLNTIFLVT